MIRKLVLPAIAAVLLSGCVTDYAYRGGAQGDYYYGRPSTQYRYDGGYGAYPYGYGRFGYGYPYSYPYGYYGSPWGYGGYHNYPYYRPYLRRPPLIHPRPDGTPPQHRRDDRPPPWRNYNELRRPRADSGGGDAQSRPPVPARPVAEPRERGSRMEQVIRRANRKAENRNEEHDP